MAMEDSAAAAGKLDDLAGGGAGSAGDWGYLASDAMATASFPAFPFHSHRDILPTPASASLLLSMDTAALFDLHAAFPSFSSSAAAPALPAFHDFASSNPFDVDAAHFLGAPPPAAAQGVQIKGGFFAPPPADFSGGMGWDDDDEIEHASSMALSASLENAAEAGGARRRGCRPRISWRSAAAGRSSMTTSTCCAPWCPRSARWAGPLSSAMRSST